MRRALLEDCVARRMEKNEKNEKKGEKKGEDAGWRIGVPTQSC
jgi:hypothetical protein